MSKKQKTTKAQTLMERMVGGKYSEMATYSDLFEKTSDVIFLLDPDTDCVLECNPAIENTLSITPSWLEGDNIIKWVEQGSQELMQSKLAVVKQERALEKPFDAVFLSNQGEKVILEISAFRLKLADYCEVIQVIGKNVTAARSAAAELINANQRLANMSNTDEMTGLYNFRYLKAEMQKEHERSQRYDRPYSVILCDIDHFKNFNDKNGHLAGDEALKKTAAILKKRARNTDIVARYGGEEFVVFCPEINGQQALLLAESLRKSIASEKFSHGQNQPLGFVSISIGVASFPQHGDTHDKVLGKADEALYESKAGGRNCASLFDASKIKKSA
jgi:diguanylate cyclase (GGDEF)-like protein